MREMAPLTGADITGVNKNADLAGSDSGAFAVLTVEQMNDWAVSRKNTAMIVIGSGRLTPG